jgi:hypothetical protein
MPIERSLKKTIDDYSSLLDNHRCSGARYESVPMAVLRRVAEQLSFLGLLAKSCFLCALTIVVVAIGSNTAQAGFVVSLNSFRSDAATCAPASSGNEERAPAVERFNTPAQDAHQGGASSGAQSSGSTSSGVTALPGPVREIHQPELPGWLVAAQRIQFPSPLPTSIFHPPRG